MAFLDGPFNMSPQRTKQPGLFNTPYSPTAGSSPSGAGAAAPSPVNSILPTTNLTGGATKRYGGPSRPTGGPIGIGTRSFGPGPGGPATPMSAAPGMATAGNGAAPAGPAPAPAPTPAPYSYSGPTMSLLSNAQAAGLAVPPPAPAAPSPFLGNFQPLVRRYGLSDGGDGSGLQPMQL